ncbi:DUF1858 domain-containing protein [Schleiferilactobacillus shenzhenensis]|uniref:DUF1858 domain-containing protein n=1 Tax=Schleiferilactobacillus shenzhenensis LY-73 TaxID=1231336 RepID=U4TQG0_9LACO|nr:DUF1858 domain-containing protein [Schleiferilactobacillus shenzhenensis]ERL64143.1 hypothetical protein L248_1585 [Schleiferilactobacillus shenzhenensis LY-73]
MIQIKATTSVYDLVQAYPEIREIMVGIGFTKIAEPGMLNSVGRFVDLTKGARLMGIPFSTIQEAFAQAGYEVITDDK